MSQPLWYIVQVYFFDGTSASPGSPSIKCNKSRHAIGDLPLSASLATSQTCAFNMPPIDWFYGTWLTLSATLHARTTTLSGKLKVWHLSQILRRKVPDKHQYEKICFIQYPFGIPCELNSIFIFKKYMFKWVFQVSVLYWVLSYSLYQYFRTIMCPKSTKSPEMAKVHFFLLLLAPLFRKSGPKQTVMEFIPLWCQKKAMIPLLG